MLREQEVVVLVGRFATQGTLLYTLHARQRMSERDISELDVRRAATSATAAMWQPDEGTWKISGGFGLDDEPITLIVAINERVRVVSVM